MRVVVCRIAVSGRVVVNGDTAAVSVVVYGIAVSGTVLLFVISL